MVLMPKVQVGSRWVIIRKGRRHKMQESPGAVPLDNRHASLDTNVAEDWSEESSSSNSSNGPACSVRPGFEAQRGR